MMTYSPDGVGAGGGGALTAGAGTGAEIGTVAGVGVGTAVGAMAAAGGLSMSSAPSKSSKTMSEKVRQTRLIVGVSMGAEGPGRPGKYVEERGGVLGRAFVDAGCGTSR